MLLLRIGRLPHPRRCCARGGQGALCAGSARWAGGSRAASTSSTADALADSPDAIAVGAPFPALPPGGLTPAMEAAIAANGTYASQVAPDSWSITHRAMELIDAVHVECGLEWWQTILALTMAIRVASFPLTLYSMRNSAALGRIKPESDELMAKAAACNMSSAEGQRRHAKIRADLFKLYRDNKCSPLYSLGPILLQLPVFVFMFSALQAMSSHKTGHPWHGFEAGGVGWFADLSVPDPYYALPLAASATFLLTTLLQDPTMVASQEQARTMQYVGMGMSVVFLPIMATTSSATVLYFAATNVVGVAQTGLLRSKTFRKLVSLPTTPPGQAAEPVVAPPVALEYFKPAAAARKRAEAGAGAKGSRGRAKSPRPRG